MSDLTTPGTMSWPPRGVGLDPEDFPQNIASVQEGLEKLSQTECLAALDELMARRPHNKTDLRWQIRLWRQERTAWKDARDRRADAKEAGLEEV